MLANDIAFHFSLKISSKQFLFSRYLKFICISAVIKRILLSIFRTAWRDFTHLSQVTSDSQMCVCLRTRMCCGRQSRARTKDPIRRYEHADPALWTYANQWQVVYEQALEKRTSGGTSRHQRHIQRSCSPSSWKHLSCSLGETDRWWHGENGFSIVRQNEHVALRTWPYKN